MIAATVLPLPLPSAPPVPPHSVSGPSRPAGHLSQRSRSPSAVSDRAVESGRPPVAALPHDPDFADELLDAMWALERFCAHPFTTMLGVEP